MAFLHFKFELQLPVMQDPTVVIETAENSSTDTSDLEMAQHPDMTGR